MSALIFILVLSILVFVHELGHYLAARRARVGVLEFGFGFPPKLWSINRGGTRWSINLIPFGGFVRLEGESDPQTDSPTSFARSSLRHKFAILAAGVGMNYLLAWLLLTTAFTAGITVDPTSLKTNQWQNISQSRIQAAVSESTMAAQAGLLTGDQILSINGRQFKSTVEVIAYTSGENYPDLQVVVKRNGKTEMITIPAAERQKQNQPVYGFALQPIAKLAYPWFVAPWYGLTTTVNFTAQTFVGFGTLISDLAATGRVSDDVAGPVGIAVLTGEVSRLGLISLLQFTAVLSISLAVINFLPLPALDGGRALFVLLERLRGRPFNPRLEQAVHATGFYLLLLALVFISIRDVQRFGVIDRVMNLFQP